MADLDTLESLREAAAAILQRNAHWKSCNDGSYEMALDNSGYYRIREKIRVLESELKYAK